MAEPRQPSTTPAASAVPRGPALPPALCGFLLLLALIFAASYAVGAAAGPVTPGMHDTGPGAGGVDDTHDMDDTRDMHGGGHG